jgi:hypothetical protein
MNFVEPCHRTPLRDGDVPAVHEAPFDAEQIQVFAEDAPDVVRVIAELVAGIGVRLRAMLDRVHAAVAVRVDQAAEEGLRMATSD